jgi:hypothetical protein
MATVYCVGNECAPADAISPRGDWDGIAPSECRIYRVSSPKILSVLPLFPHEIVIHFSSYFIMKRFTHQNT